MEMHISRSELISTLVATQDLVAPVVAGHGKRVAAFSSLISEALGYTEGERERLVLAAQLHDIGCFPLSIKEMADLHTFDVLAPQKHCAAGCILLSQCSLFKDITRTILHHHNRWDKTHGRDVHGDLIPEDANIIHLADRIDILINDKSRILDIKDAIIKSITELRGSLFAPRIVRAFEDVASRDSFWLRGIHHEYDEQRLPLRDDTLMANHLFEMIDILTLTIDFKSRFTSTHSAGVSATAMALGTLVGYRDILHLMLAGSLHDIGKLVVPNEILDKNGPLSAEERSLMSTHPFHTLNILRHVKGLSDVARTASFHQEKLNGEGYPFRPTPEEYTTPARIVAISDIFTALTEDRPYRVGLQKSNVLKILSNMAEELHIAPDLFEVVEANYDQLNHTRIVAQEEARNNYGLFWSQTAKAMDEIQ